MREERGERIKERRGGLKERGSLFTARGPGRGPSQHQPAAGGQGWCWPTGGEGEEEDEGFGGWLEVNSDGGDGDLGGGVGDEDGDDGEESDGGDGGGN